MRKHILLSSFLCLPGLLAAQSPTSISATWVKNATYVPCSISGAGPFNCLLDTGSTMTGISPSVAAKLKLTTHSDPTQPNVGLADKMLAPLQVTLGGYTWTAEPASLLPPTIQTLDKENGVTTDVVLGTSLLQHSQVTIDPEQKQVRLAPLGSPVDPTAQKIDLLIANGIGIAILGVKSTNNRRIDAPFTVDTGSMAPLLLGKEFWSTRSPIASSNVAEKPGTTLMRIDAIALGKLQLHNVPAGMPAHEAGILSVKSLGGMLGAPILARFIVTYDFSQHALWLKPTANWAQPFP